MNHITDNHDALLDYLYEEGDPAERLTIAKHLQECAACAVAVLEFQNVRGMLSDWKPPASPIGFRCVPDASIADVRRDHRARGSHDELKHGRARVAGARTQQRRWQRASGCRRHSVIRVGHGGLAAPRGLPGWCAESELAARCVGDAADLPRHVDHAASRRESRVRGTNDRSVELRGSVTRLQRASDLLQRVRAMIDQSEQRQQRELALRLSQVSREVDTQHQVDLLRIQQDFGRQQEATMEYLVKTSGGTK